MHIILLVSLLLHFHLLYHHWLLIQLLYQCALSQSYFAHLTLTLLLMLFILFSMRSTCTNHNQATHETKKATWLPLTLISDNDTMHYVVDPFIRISVSRVHRHNKQRIAVTTLILIWVQYKNILVRKDKVDKIWHLVKLCLVCTRTGQMHHMRQIKLCEGVWDVVSVE